MSEGLEVILDEKGCIHYSFTEGYKKREKVIREIRNDYQCGKGKAKEILSEIVRDGLESRFPGVPVLDQYTQNTGHETGIYQVFQTFSRDQNSIFDLVFRKKKGKYADHLRFLLMTDDNEIPTELEGDPSDDLLLDFNRIHGSGVELYSKEWESFCIYFADTPEDVHELIKLGMHCPECGERGHMLLDFLK